MISDSGSSNMSEIAGRTSVPRSMTRIVRVPIGRGMSAITNIRNAAICGTLVVSVYAMHFFRLSNI